MESIFVKIKRVQIVKKTKDKRKTGAIDIIRRAIFRKA